jgi:hypothetical protein
MMINLSQVKTNSQAHCSIDIHIDLSFSRFDGSGSSRGKGTLGSIKLRLHGTWINVIKLDSLGTDNVLHNKKIQRIVNEIQRSTAAYFVSILPPSITYGNGILVGQSISSSNKVLFRVSKTFLMKDLQNARLELSNVWNVVGRYTVLSLYTRNDDLEHRGTIIDRFVRDTEV